MATHKSSLRSALEDAHTKYTLRNPASLQAHQEACIHLPGGNTRSVLHASPFPLTFASGRGSTLTSLDGDTYTDFLGEYSAGIFGHSNPRIAAAVEDAMSRGWNFGGLSTNEAVLSRRVCERFGLGMVRFTNSGTEANTMALAVALAFAQSRSGTGLKRKILVFTNAYHGATISFPMSTVMELRRRGAREDTSGRLPPIATANLPHEFVFAPYNNIRETKAIIEALVPSANTSLAAILVEPVQGAGGCRPASRKFLKYLRALADMHSAILIADEVMTSRLAPHGLCAEWGIRPDLMTLGKWIGGGMSFGAFGGKREIMELFDPASSSAGKLSHAGTFNNNVLSMAAGCVGLEICTPDRIRGLSALGEDLKGRIQEVLIEHGIMPIPTGADDEEDLEIDSFDESSNPLAEKTATRTFVTGYGSLVNVRFHGHDADVWQGLFYHHMLEENIYLATRGYMALTLELAQEDITRLVNAVTRFVRRYSSDLKKSS